jgi:predicted AAA+ superfamily ATPase
MITLDFIEMLKTRLAEPEPRIQVILGPRQVGKTTGVLELLKTSTHLPPSHYASADAIFRGDWAWIEAQWREAAAKGPGSILVLDEIQKIEAWSEYIKKLWDESIYNSKRLRVVLLGSSSLDLQQGLADSLAGRFELLRAYHWNFTDWSACFGGTLEDYLVYGGYPGAAEYQKDQERWLDYMRRSIVEMVIEKDIMQQTKILRPALFKQVFELCCSYPASEISLRKLVGQLQDPGSLETVQSYMEILEAAFLIKTLQKFSSNPLQKKSSSPKILPLAPALVSFARQATQMDSEEKGRIFELIVGLELLRMPGHLYYWREDQHEVDFVYKRGRKIWAIEVKSGRKKGTKGLMKFKEAFTDAELLMVSPENFQDILKNVRAN